MYPKPDRKKELARKRRSRDQERREFTEQVVKADSYTCQNLYQNGHVLILDAHHILGKSRNEVKFGITLCRTCHTLVEVGGKSSPAGLWMPGNALMLIILDRLKREAQDFRWDEALEILRAKITNRSTQTKGETND